MARVSLRPYQQALVTSARASMLAGNKRVLCYLPTGGGKTRAATAMVQSALGKSPDARVVVLANRKILVHQFADALRAASIDVGILQGDNTHGLDRRVLVASIDTVYTRGVPDDVCMFIIDEAHGVAGNKKYRELLFRFNRIPVVGLSATPFSKGLGKPYAELADKPLFESLIVGATVQALVDDGYLTDLDIYAPSAPDMTGAKTSRTADGEQDYRQADIDAAANKPELVGDILSHWFRLARGQKTIVFASSIAHSQHIVERFNKSGVPAEHLDCYMDDTQRAEIIGRFERGETCVLSNVALLSEGFDVPSTSCMILARPTKSLIRFIQMVGRVLRPAPGKTKALLLDHSGSVERLGHPFDELPLVLDDGQPNKAGQQQREAPKPKPCPACKYVRPAGIHECPQCGFAPQRQSDVEVADGELKKMQRRKREKTGLADRQEVFSGLLHVARERGYQKGWVGHSFRDLYGLWPRKYEQIPRPPSPELRNWLLSRTIRIAKTRAKEYANVVC